MNWFNWIFQLAGFSSAGFGASVVVVVVVGSTGLHWALRFGDFCCSSCYGWFYWFSGEAGVASTSLIRFRRASTSCSDC